MIRLIIFGLAIYAVYALFLKDKIIVIDPRKPKNDKSKYSDYEEIN